MDRPGSFQQVDLALGLAAGRVGAGPIPVTGAFRNNSCYYKRSYMLSNIYLNTIW